MKQKDIVFILVVAFLSGMSSFFLTRTVIIRPDTKKQKAEVVEPISADFKLPSEVYFNDKSVNPTKTIQIGNDENKKPF